MNAFAKFLVDELKKRGLQKQDVANKFNWTPMYFGRYCKGQLLPTKNNIDKFADFLGISIEEIEELMEQEVDD